MKSKTHCWRERKNVDVVFDPGEAPDYQIVATRTKGGRSDLRSALEALFGGVEMVRLISALLAFALLALPLVDSAANGSVSIEGTVPHVDFVAEVLPDPAQGDPYWKDFLVGKDELLTVLREYESLSQERWQHQFSHVAGGDRTGTLKLLDNTVVRYMVRPGGLATLTFADGRVVYLAKTGRNPSLPTLRGIVTHQGKPVAKATVELHAEQRIGRARPNLLASVRTADDGSYFFDSLPGEPSQHFGVPYLEYRLRVQHEELTAETDWESLNIATGPMEGSESKTRFEGKEHQCNVAMRRGGFVQGTVFRSDGKPATFEQVVLLFPGTHELIVKTDDAGRYRAGPIHCPEKPGSVLLCGVCQILDAQITDIWNSQHEERAPGLPYLGSVEVRSGETTSCDWHLPPDGAEPPTARFTDGRVEIVGIDWSLAHVNLIGMAGKPAMKPNRSGLRWGTGKIVLTGAEFTTDVSKTLSDKEVQNASFILRGKSGLAKEFTDSQLPALAGAGPLPGPLPVGDYELEIFCTLPSRDGLSMRFWQARSSFTIAADKAPDANTITVELMPVNAPLTIPDVDMKPLKE